MSHKLDSFVQVLKHRSDIDKDQNDGRNDRITNMSKHKCAVFSRPNKLTVNAVHIN